MTFSNRSLLFIVVVTLMASMACDAQKSNAATPASEKAKAQAPSTTEAAAQKAPASQPSSKPAASQPESSAPPPEGSGDAAALAAVMDQYEKMREALAADNHDAIPGLVKTMAEAATTAKTGAKGDVATQLDKLTAAAVKMAPEKNTELQRKSFGDISRAAVSISLAVPALQSGKHIFHCPMAQGYPKWIQVQEEMANPYMGKRMLKCGTKSKWKL